MDADVTASAGSWSPKTVQRILGLDNERARLCAAFPPFHVIDIFIIRSLWRPVLLHEGTNSAAHSLGMTEQESTTHA
jgi:hypothetical protein